MQLAEQTLVKLVQYSPESFGADTELTNFYKAKAEWIKMSFRLPMTVVVPPTQRLSSHKQGCNAPWQRQLALEIQQHNPAENQQKDYLTLGDALLSSNQPEDARYTKLVSLHPEGQTSRWH